MKIFGHLVLSLAILICPSITAAQQAKRPFTVADDIAFTQFDTAQRTFDALRFSPDGKYFAVWSERGRLDLNAVEDSLRFYSTEDIQAFLRRPSSQPPEPIWVATATAKRTPAIAYSEWLPDSSGMAFEQWGDAESKYQIQLADLRTKTIVPLTSPDEDVRAFSVRSRDSYVYVVADHSEWLMQKQTASQSGTVVGTGVGLWQLLFPDDPRVMLWNSPSTRRLWAVVDGKRFEVKHNGEPPKFDEQRMALSPDGMSIAATAPVAEVPSAWKTLYPAPEFLSYGEGAFHPQHPIEQGTATQYVRIDLKSGTIEPLINAPTMDSVGIWTVGYLRPAWSRDSQSVLLPGTFVETKQNQPSRPCIAIVELRSKNASCLTTPKEGYTKNTDPVDDFHRAVEVVTDAHFAPGDERRVFVSIDTRGGEPGITRQYQRTSEGSWHAVGETIGLVATGPGGLEISVKATFKDPPLLIAKSQQTSRVLWDANPQLKDLQLADVSLYKWKDPEGREWKGGLYKPVNYEPGKRYPLVIQTHGFGEREFAPSGLFTTAFAAQELAAAGIMVLQVGMPVDHDCKMEGPEEGPCNARVFESGAKQLVSQGLVDPDRIGITGFSRTCYYVMELLTTNLLHLKAASITDGILNDHFMYTFFAGGDEQDKMMGGKPFGDGLQQWFKHSPEFNLDKVDTPLIVNTIDGGAGAITMWAPYAGLHNLKKPVDLIVIDGAEHVATNPEVRMASQGGSVDWFRFWLQGYEDPDPAKADQYKRWREMRTLQTENDRKAATEASASLKK